MPTSSSIGSSVFQAALTVLTDERNERFRYHGGSVKYRKSIEIDAEPAKVWAALIDVERWPGWMGTNAEVKMVDAGVLHLGSRIHVSQPDLGTSTWTVTKWDPEQTFCIESGGFLMKTSYERRVEIVDSARSRATVTVTHSGPLNWPGRFLFAKQQDAYLQAELETLKGLSE
jgi:uncharacterized protein YndB with AHSA1/START domain